MSLNNLSSAKFVHDVESDLHYVEMVYMKWNNRRKDTIDTLTTSTLNL